MMLMPRRFPLAAPLAIAALVLSACGSGESKQGEQAKADAGRLEVVTAFYPLQFVTEQIGGDHIAVTSLTKPGAEPHDIELTPRDVATVSKAKLVVYEEGFQGAVDKAVETQGGDRGLDVAPAANLDLVFKPQVGAAAARSEENTPGTTDPHFWLDPQRYSAAAKVIAERLSVVDPANKADYAKNAKVFEDRLASLSKEFDTGLAKCKRNEIVTSHAAFGYLADRFGMKQIAIAGLSPDQEPLPAELAAVSTYAKAHGVKTIYAETLASPAIARTVAQESGAELAILDPIEGLTEKSAGKDYFEVMRSNLKALRAGQDC